MFNSAIIDTVIGLMLMYASLALVVSGINEFFSARCRSRARLLEQAICQFVGDDLFKSFYTHPRIAFLTQEPDNFSPGLRLPSYLEASTFSNVLLHTVSDHLKSEIQRVTSDDRAMPGAGHFAGLQRAIQQRLTQLPAATIQSGNDAELRFWRLMSEAAHRAESVGQTPSEKLAALHEELERFYKEVMDRAAGWYKRRSHWASFWVGLMVCIALNADTLMVARSLSVSPALRANLVKSAIIDTKPGQGGGPCVNNAPGGPEAGPKFQAGNPNSGCLSAQDARSSQLGAAFPIGWMAAEQPQWTALTFLMKGLGILISALAVSLGAVFWFNALKSVLRLAGRVPDAEVPQKTGAGSVGGVPSKPMPSMALMAAKGMELENKGAVSLRWACRLLKACQCTYVIGPNGVTNWTRCTGYDGVGFLSMPAAVCRGNRHIDACLIGETSEAIILAFRGTLPLSIKAGSEQDQETLKTSIDDWLQDADAVLVEAPVGIPGMVHQGFKSDLDALWDTIASTLRALQPAGSSRPLLVTGHSKGGSVAYLAAMRAQQAGFNVGGVYTFAAARPGNTDFARACESQLSGLWRFEYQNDIVPHLPPSDGLWDFFVRHFSINPNSVTLRLPAYASVGTLQFIDWQNHIVDDSSSLTAERIIRLTLCQGEGNFRQIIEDHELDGGYAAVICQ